MTPKGPHIYLVTLGISQNHGSELSVGWQWYRRLSKRSSVSVMTHRIFENDRFLDRKLQARCIFFGTRPSCEEKFNRFHVFYAFTFWFACRRYLKDRLTDNDRVVIVTPAALWFLPLLGGLRHRREQFAFGPIGGELLPARLLMSRSERLRANARNVLTCALLLAWRIMALQLPARIGFRSSNTERVFPANSFMSSGITPEVEIAFWPTEPAARMKKSPQTSTTNLVFLDGRLRKNTPRNLAVGAALSLAVDTTIILGSRTSYRRYKAACNVISGAIWKETLPRSEFLALLSQRQPNVVALSLSEGVPGFLLEALTAGCWVLTYPFGGIEWLVESAAEVIEVKEVAGLSIPGGAIWLRWDQESLDHYQANSELRLNSFMGAITQ